MHLTEFGIRDIRSLKYLTWKIGDTQKTSGWHVFLGENGSGKSTIVKAVALSLIGPQDAQYLQQNWPSWIRKGRISGISATIFKYHNRFDEFQHNTPIKESTGAAITIEPDGRRIASPKSRISSSQHYKSKDSTELENLTPPELHVWSNNRGWFSASFGPYRRFTGGDPKYLDAYFQNPKAAPHISAFGEDSALAGALSWLKDQARPTRKEGRKILELVKRIVNSDSFLPKNTLLEEITEDDILFKDASGNIIEIEQLGDGFRSALSILLELLHQLILAFGIEALTEPDRPGEIIIPGVVLIDEVDAHLHPTWQQHIGFWLTKRFPEMQFIVTTHSPLICQAATTVFKLPTPGTDEEGRFLEGVELDRLKYGNILEAYASDAFGKIEQSEEGKEKLKRLADLTRLSWERDLTDAEREEQANLRAIFIASPVGG